MRFTKVRTVPVVLAGLVGTAIVAVQSPAEAAITTTTITSPVDGTHYMITGFNQVTVAVTGTTDGTTGDLVDIRCYSVGSSDYQSGPSNVGVQADGSFSVLMDTSSPYGTCRLRAVPNDLPDGADISSYAGPRVTSEFLRSQTYQSGPNLGKTFDYAIAFQGSHALYDFSSATQGGYWDSRLSFPDGSSSNYLWDGSGARLGGNDGTRSRIQVDGRNAYGPASAQTLSDIANAPSLTFSATRNGVTGVTTIREADPLVFCPAGASHPPVASTCPQYTSAGVRLERTIVANDGGRQVHISDVWRSTDGKAHSISAHYQHAVHGFDYVTDADTPVAFRLPWSGGFQTFTGDATYPGPAKLANTIFVRDSNTTPDGNTLLPRGAITFDFPLSVHRTDYDKITMKGATFTVPGGGARTMRQSFVIGTTDAEVAAKAAANAARLNPYRVDELIKKKGGANVGNGVYNTTGLRQTVTARTKRASTATFLVTVQNDGTQPTSFRIKGTGARAGFAVAYVKGSAGKTKITRAVVRGNYLLSNVAPGTSRVLRLVVTVKPGTRVSAIKSWLVLATSTSDGTRKDAVKAKVRVVR